MRELDPSKVIPGRVQAAFDVLKEGVLILDEKEHIVLANTAFAEMVGRSAANLIGYKGSELGWYGFSSPRQKEMLPWKQVLREKKNVTGTRLSMKRENAATLTFIANSAPVLDGKGKSRGVLVTLDDVTEIETKNKELSEVVSKLRQTTDVVQTKNKELEFLATHDPLTLLLNRRALNQQFEKVFGAAQDTGVELSCVMCDIDHFKSVNDRYGHATGDKVIKMIAAMLQKNFRENDLVGRYGGEEFCIVLPNVGLRLAQDICNRIRKSIKDDTSTGVQVTMSFGISALTPTVNSPHELAAQADRALYIAKESGRNQVVCWGDDEVSEFSGKGAKAAEDSVEEAADFVEENRADELLEAVEVVKADKEVERLNVRLRELEVIAERRTQELQHFSAYDAATGLPTRTLFRDRVSQALMRGRRFDNIVAVLSISIDAVQRVNETLGHESGESLLMAIGKRLGKILRSMDTVAKLPSDALKPTVSRLGQEDFGVLLTDIEEVSAITWIVKRILNALNEPFKVAQQDIYTATNIGISIYPHDGQTAEELERNASAAKSHVKKTLGPNRYYFYSQHIHTTSIKHLNLENRLHQAIEQEEFVVHYQPILNTRSGLIQGAEALIRWNHPETGLVPPYEFIPIAEYSGLITSIGHWVMRTACEQVRSWLDMGIENCCVAVNFSNKQFRDTHLVQKIRDLLLDNALEPGHLTVEVTENSMMESINSSMLTLHEIREMGVNIALDDFGTGYSSLGYLKNFPVTHVKIDRSFIADIETNERDAILVKSIINMAHGMGLKVIAEGVENELQAQILHDFDCDEMQGFLFSKPVPLEEITTLFQNGIKKRIALWQPDVAA